MKSLYGAFQRPDGSPAAGAALSFLLSHAAANPSVGHVEHSLLTVILDANGLIPGGTFIWANDELNQQSGIQTTYRVTCKDTVYGLVFDEVMSIIGPSPINLNQIP
jgi:hypothetical protein